MSPSHRSSLSPARCAAAGSPAGTAAIRRPFPGSGRRAAMRSAPGRVSG